MTFDPDELGKHRTDLSEALRALRKASGLTGQTVARRAGMSQAKLSKLENGRVLPSALDVERILGALAVSEQTRKDILALARTVNTEYRGFRASLKRGLYQTQRELRAIEASATEVRHFLPAMVTGLLQTPEYAQQVLSHPHVNGGTDYRKALAGRLERQSILYDTGKSFTFVFTEPALRWQICPPPAMAVQVDRIVSLSMLPNVRIGVIPLDLHVPHGPMNTFVVYDDRLATVENFTGSVILRDPRDIAYSLAIFEFFEGYALFDEQARSLLRDIAASLRR